MNIKIHFLVRTTGKLNESTNVMIVVKSLPVKATLEGIDSQFMRVSSTIVSYVTQDSLKLVI